MKYNKWPDRWPVNSDNSVFIYLFCHNWRRDQDTPLSTGGRRIRRGEHRNFHWDTEEIKTDLDFTLKLIHEE